MSDTELNKCVESLNELISGKCGMSYLRVRLAFERTDSNTMYWAMKKMFDGCKTHKKIAELVCNLHKIDDTGGMPLHLSHFGIHIVQISEGIIVKHDDIIKENNMQKSDVKFNLLDAIMSFFNILGCMQ
jgi:hypothetical protein